MPAADSSKHRGEECGFLRCKRLASPLQMTKKNGR